jgi:hypothetical protein
MFGKIRLKVKNNGNEGINLLAFHLIIGVFARAFQLQQETIS